MVGAPSFIAVHKYKFVYFHTKLEFPSLEEMKHIALHNATLSEFRYKLIRFPGFEGILPGEDG